MSFDFSKIIARSRAVSKQLSGGVAHLLKKAKVPVFDGYGKLDGVAGDKRKVLVTPTKGAPVTLTAKHVILATGARARTLPGLEPDGKLIWSYREALVPDELPRRLLVIGSGAIGSEFASFYRNMGSEVTLVEVAPRILPVEDEEISALARKAFENRAFAS